MGDPLRGLAALSVALYHVAFFTLPFTLPQGGSGGVNTLFVDAYGAIPGALAESLQLGLYIFFVLSGYLIARPFIAWLADLGDTPRLGRYALRRVLRIVPAFWAAIAATLVLHGLAGGDLADLIAFVFFAQTYHPSPLSAYVGQGWTLSVELCFYALLPLAAFALRPALARLSTRGRLIAIAVGIVAAGVASLALRSRFTSLEQSRALPMMFFAFTPGMLLATLELWLGTRAARLARPGHVAGALLSLALVAAALRQMEQLRTPLGVGVLSAVACGCFVAAPLVVQWSGRGAWRSLDNPSLHWLGERSYGLYVFHALVIFAVAPVARGLSPIPGFAAVAAISMPICLAVAHLSYHAIELPFQRLGRAGRTGRTFAGFGSFAIVRRPVAIAALAAAPVLVVGALGLLDERGVARGPQDQTLQAGVPDARRAAEPQGARAVVGARRARRRPAREEPAGAAHRGRPVKATPSGAAPVAGESGARSGHSGQGAAEPATAVEAPAGGAGPSETPHEDAALLACARAREAAERSVGARLTGRERRRVRRACQLPEAEAELPVPATGTELPPVPDVIPTVVPPDLP